MHGSRCNSQQIGISPRGAVYAIHFALAGHVCAVSNDPHRVLRGLCYR